MASESQSLVSANTSMVQDLANRNRDLVQKTFDILIEGQDTASKHHGETLEPLQQISKGVQELILKQAQAIEGASEDHKREQFQMNRIASSFEQVLETIPSRPCPQSAFTALKERRQHTDSNELEVVVAFW